MLRWLMLLLWRIWRAVWARRVTHEPVEGALWAVPWGVPWGKDAD
jgi:hypothetical protein